jgi:rare lipoprotein A
MRSCTKIVDDHRRQCSWAFGALAPFTAMFIAVVTVICSSSCAKHVSVARPVSIGHSETGIASWYGEPFQGRKTASGEVYDMNKLTAAHRTLPFGTWVEVTNLVNAKRVEVRITDRGPFIDGRVIDLSKAAAKQIDLITPGIVRVRLKVIRAPRLLPEDVTSCEGRLKPTAS